MKKFLLGLWRIDAHIRTHIRISQKVSRIPILGRYVTMFLDRILLFAYGIDVDSRSVRVKSLSIAHPSGVLLGGNGIVSTGRVVIMSGAKFVGSSPTDPVYLERHRQGNVFSLGDNVIIGTGSTVIGPISICDDVFIGAMSLVKKDISEPGVYVGIPVQKISSRISNEWTQNL